MNKYVVTLWVNDEERTALVTPNRTLAQMLREDLGLTGVKQGCGVGDCGSCTVLLDGQTVNSCLVLAVQTAGRRVTTIEGLTPDKGLSTLQTAFVEQGAIQCGFCTPGMIVSASALLAANAAPSEAEIRHGLSGNLCRCTGYQKIIDAVELAASKQGGK